MSEKKLKTDESTIKSLKGFSPFTSRVSASKQDDFDQFYDDISEKVIFKSTGQKDSDGNDLGVAETILVIKKIDIHELLESQRDTVGVESYIRSLALQGESIDDYNTQIVEKVDDYSQMPDTLAEVMLAGDRAKKAFADMDPDLKGGHTTIEGFLNSLTKDSLDSYLKAKIEALMPSKKEGD